MAAPLDHERMAEVFDAEADTYAATVEASLAVPGGSVRHFADRKVHVLQSLLKQVPAEILDFGCGTGTLSAALLDGFPSTVILGVDPSARSIARAAATVHAAAGRVSFAVSGAHRLELGDGAAEVAVAACVFHHIVPAERDSWIAELYRVLKPGGSLVVFEHNPWNPLTRRSVDRCPFDAGVELLPSPETASRMRAAGFQRVRTRHYLFLPPALYSLRRLEPLLSWLPFGGQYAVIGTVPGHGRRPRQR